MNPTFLDSMSWEMAEVYGAISDQILINLAHYFPYFKVDKLPTSAFAYQSAMLAQMGQVNRETARIIARGLDGANEALENAIEQAIISSVRSREPELYKAVKKGILQPPGQIPIITPNQTRAFSLYYKQAADKLNLVNTVMLESTQQAYQMTVSDIVSRMRATQTALDIGAGETITGVSSWNSAMEHAISRMKDNGITGFIDHAGRHWSAEAYTAMDIRTTVYNTARAAVWEMNQDFGNDLYIVSYHSGARPLCYDWQNKVISALNNARDTVDLDGNAVHVYAQSETTYGEPAGLFGINCKHYPDPFIPGVTRVGQTPETPEQNEKAYQESQTQRRLERKIREEKRDLEMLKAQNAPENLIQAQRDRVKATSQQINDFCDQTGRARHRDREAVYTRRDFPSMKTYDPRQFVADQKNMIDRYFADGGAQREFKFGIMTPLVPLVPNPPQTPPVNVAGQATNTPPEPATMNYGQPFEGYETKYRKPQVKQFADAKETLTNAPETARKTWDKVADKLKAPNVDSANDGAFYSPYSKTTNYKSYKKAFDESSYQRKNACFFHEYGHNIDNLLAVGGRDSYYSVEYLSKDGHMFTQILEREAGDVIGRFYLKENGLADAYEAVKAAQNGPGGMGFGSFTRQLLKGVMPGDEWRAIRDTVFDAGDDDNILRPLVEKWLKPHFDAELRDIARHNDEIAGKFCDWVQSRYSKYETTDVSDIFGNYMTRCYGSDYAYPFGVGHSASYQRDIGNLPKEAFAEFFSATVTQSDSLKGIRDLLPESYDFFIEMLEDATK